MGKRILRASTRLLDGYTIGAVGLSSLFPENFFISSRDCFLCSASATTGIEPISQGHWVLEEDVREVAAAVVSVVASTEYGQSLLDHPAVAEGLVALLKSERGTAQIVAVRALWGLCQLEGGSEQVWESLMYSAHTRPL